jgi:hypothetical protein
MSRFLLRMFGRTRVLSELSTRMSPHLRRSPVGSRAVIRRYCAAAGSIQNTSQWWPSGS